MCFLRRVVASAGREPSVQPRVDESASVPSPAVPDLVSPPRWPAGFDGACVVFGVIDVR